jgi:hypothetical protein
LGVAVVKKAASGRFLKGLFLRKELIWLRQVLKWMRTFENSMNGRAIHE